MKRNEASYRQLVMDVLTDGVPVKGRNGDTIEIFGGTIKLDVSDNLIPVITGRKMYPRGVIGEALAFMQTDCKHLSDFEERGCNYWKLWADEDGNLNVDYPIHKHLYRIIKDIKENPTSRRHIINLWNQDNLEALSLPCCHYSYQFNIQGNKINMIWTQRSADVMVGVPSDMILATIYLRIVAQETGYEANEITMNFGSCHIYEEHIEGAYLYTSRKFHKIPILKISKKPFEELTQDDIQIIKYTSYPPIKFELKA